VSRKRNRACVGRSERHREVERRLLARQLRKSVKRIRAASPALSRSRLESRVAQVLVLESARTLASHGDAHGTRLVLARAPTLASQGDRTSTTREQRARLLVCTWISGQPMTRRQEVRARREPSALKIAASDHSSRDLYGHLCAPNHACASRGP